MLSTPPLPEVPKAPPPPPMFGQVQGNRPQRKPSAPTFLGSAASPSSGQLGNNTLLGQA